MLRELGEAADRLRVRFVAVAEPEWQRRAPISIARDRPIDVVLEPFAKAAVSDLGRMPTHASVSRQHRVAICRRSYEPRRASVIQQRRTAPPAVRVRVRDTPSLEQHAAPLELLDEQGVGILHELAAGNWEIA